MFDPNEAKNVFERNGWIVTPTRPNMHQEWSMIARKNLDGVDALVVVCKEIKEEDVNVTLWWGEYKDYVTDELADDIGDLIYVLHFFRILAHNQKRFPSQPDF